jgi:hypothetical protein
MTTFQRIQKQVLKTADTSTNRNIPFMILGFYVNTKQVTVEEAEIIIRNVCYSPNIEFIRGVAALVPTEQWTMLPNNQARLVFFGEVWTAEIVRGDVDRFSVKHADYYDYLFSIH